MAVEHNLSASVCIYNMHGYRSGSSFLKHLCLDNDIKFVQENCLFKSQLQVFNDLVVSDFYLYCDKGIHTRAPISRDSQPFSIPEIPGIS